MKNFNSLKKNREYKKIYEEKNYITNNIMTLYIGKNEKEKRIGFSVSKKVGNSVVRHTIIRRLREIYREEKKNIKDFYDVIIVCKRSAKEATYEELKRNFLFLCKRKNILKEQEKN